MKKWLLSLLCLLFISLQLPNGVFAHTDLEASMPAEGEKVTTDLETVVLTFSTKIEPLSKMVLKNSGKEIPLNISIEDNQMTGKVTKPLDNGDYIVEYKVIGADSHVIEGNYTFTVDRLEAAKSKKEQTVKSEQKNEKAIDETNKKEPENPGYFAPLTICLFVIIAIISYFIFRKK